MPNKDKKLSLKTLKRVLHYDPLTGAWIRREMKSGRRANKKSTGYRMPSGYLRIKIGNSRFLAHVLAWFYMTGKWPTRIVDHEDNDNTNDRWDNLRLATRLQNRVNSKCRFDNVTGVKGVRRLASGTYRALVICEGKRYYQSGFASAEAANAAYYATARSLFGKFARAQ